MGNAVVIGQFHHLGIDQNQFHLVRTGFVHDAGQQRIYTDGLAAAGSARYQQMGHLGEVDRNYLAFNILAQSDTQLGRTLADIFTVNDFPEADHIIGNIRRFDADSRFPRNGRLHPDAGGSQAQRDIVRQVYHRADLYAGRGFQFIPGNRRPPCHAGYFGIDPEIRQGLFQLAALFSYVGIELTAVCLFYRIQKFQRRENVLFFFLLCFFFCIGMSRFHLFIGSRTSRCIFGNFFLLVCRFHGSVRNSGHPVRCQNKARFPGSHFVRYRQFMIHLCACRRFLPVTGNRRFLKLLPRNDGTLLPGRRFRIVGMARDNTGRRA